jgi:hypothetical protein
MRSTKKPSLSIRDGQIEKNSPQKIVAEFLGQQFANLEDFR